MANYLVLSCRIKLYSPHKRESICTVVWQWRLKDYLDLFCFTLTLRVGTDLLQWNLKTFKCVLHLDFCLFNLNCSLVVLIFVPFNIVISLNIVFDIQLLEYMIPPAPPAAPPSRVMVLVRVIALACAMMFCLQIDLEGADIINGLNVGWSSHQTEVKASDCSSWQESASALKTQKYCVVC